MPSVSKKVEGLDGVPHASVSAMKMQSGVRRKKHRRSTSLEVEIRRSAQQIFDSGMGEAMKAAALMICARKLDEVRSILAATGFNGLVTGVSVTATPPVQAVATPAPPPIKNPCVQCGRTGVYKTKPNQFNRSGSWYCRAHLVLGRSGEAEDQMDRMLTPTPPAAPPIIQPQAAPSGASSLAEAMGMAELDEQP